METSLDSFDSKTMELIDDDLLVRLSKKFNLGMLGILMLEKKPKGFEPPTEKRRRKAELEKKQYNDETVLALFNLYKSLGDNSSARGIYLQDISIPDRGDVEEAMSYEILHQYEKAQSCYKNSIKEQDIDSKLHDFLVENYVNASEKLSAWEDISKVINPEVDFDTEWKMSKYICAASHLQIEKTDNEEILQKALQFVKKRGKDSLKDYPLEMASIFVLKGKSREASFWTDLAVKKCLKDWTGKNPYHSDSHQKTIFSMQQCSNYIKGLDGGFLEGKIVKRQIGSDLQNNDHLINQWKILSGNDANIQDLQEITYQCLDICHDQGLKTE